MLEGLPVVVAYRFSCEDNPSLFLDNRLRRSIGFMSATPLDSYRQMAASVGLNRSIMQDQNTTDGKHGARTPTEA